MKSMQLYKDLLTEIDILEAQLRVAEKEYKQIYDTSLMNGPRPLGAIDYEQERVKGGPTQMKAYTALGKIGEVVKRYNELVEELRLKRELKREIEEHIKSFEGLEYKIAYKRIIENKTLKEVADELNFNYGHIRNVASKMGKKVTNI